MMARRRCADAQHSCLAFCGRAARAVRVAFFGCRRPRVGFSRPCRRATVASLSACALTAFCADRLATSHPQNRPHCHTPDEPTHDGRVRGLACHVARSHEQSKNSFGMSIQVKPLDGDSVEPSIAALNFTPMAWQHGDGDDGGGRRSAGRQDI